MARILAVDDEDNILHSLERTFLLTDHQLETAISGAAALAMLREEPYDVVISDMRMPVMNGQQLLAQTRRLYPDIIRFILSGYADREIILETARLGDAKAFLVKPWQNQEIVGQVEQALALREDHRRRGVAPMVAAFRDYPLGEAEQQKLLQLLAAERQMEPLVQGLAACGPLVAAILRIAWLVFAGSRPTSLYHAISLLGAESLRQIVANYPVQEEKEQPVAGWVDFRHGLQVQRWCICLLQALGIPRREIDCDYLGLVHDVGRYCLLEQPLRESLEPAFGERVTGGSLAPVPGAPEMIEHGELGAALLEWWELPDRVCQAVRWHHQPERAAAEDRPWAALLHLADILACPNLATAAADTPQPAALAALGLTLDRWQALKEEISHAG